MKKLTLAIILMIVFQTLFAQNSKVIKIGWENWKPYQYKNESGTLTGLDIELIKAISQHAGYQVEFVELPWTRHLKMIENGTIDIALGASKNKEREIYANFSNSYREEKAVLYVKKDDVQKYKFNNLEELLRSDFTLGIRREYYYGEEFLSLKKNKELMRNVQIVDSEKINFQKLVSSRIDGLLIDPYAGAAVAKEINATNDVAVNDLKIFSDDIFIMISKKTKHGDIVEKLNKSLAELKKNGKIAEIISKYL